MRKNFWKTIPLNDFSHEEWELLCDGCGKCCLNKFQKTKKNVFAQFTMKEKIKEKIVWYYHKIISIKL